MTTYFRRELKTAIELEREWRRSSRGTYLSARATCERDRADSRLGVVLLRTPHASPDPDCCCGRYACRTPDFCLWYWSEYSPLGEIPFVPEIISEVRPLGPVLVGDTTFLFPDHADEVVRCSHFEVVALYGRPKGAVVGGWDSMALCRTYLPHVPVFEIGGERWQRKQALAERQKETTK